MPSDCLVGVVGRLGDVDRRRLRALDRTSWVIDFRGGGLDMEALDAACLLEGIGRFDAPPEAGVELFALAEPLACPRPLRGGLA